MIEASSGESPAAPAWPWPWRVARAVAVALLLVLFAIALRRMDLGRAWVEMTTARPLWLVAAIVAFASILPLWAAQWKLLAPAAASGRRADGGGSMLGVVAISSSVLNTTAMLAGEATAVMLLVTRAGLERASALSVLAMDQLLVGLSKLAVLAAAAALVPLPAWMQRAMLTLLAGVAALLVALLIAAWRHADLSRWSDRLLPTRFRGALLGLGDALAPLRSPALGGSALLLAFAKKAVEVLAMLCVQRAFGLTLPPATGILLLAALDLSTLLPVTPGHVGIYEAAVVFTYTRLGVPPERALGIAVVQHLCYFVALALPGLWWIVGARRAREHSADT